jgi:hypothetical protein
MIAEVLFSFSDQQPAIPQQQEHSEAKDYSYYAIGMLYFFLRRVPISCGTLT